MYPCTHTYVHIHTYAHLLKDGNLLWQCPAHLPDVDSVVGCLVEGLPVGDGHLCRAHAHQDALSSRDTANHTQTGQLCSSQSAPQLPVPLAATARAAVHINTVLERWSLT